MKKLLFHITAITILSGTVFVGNISAMEKPSDELPQLFFRAINAGYKDDQSSQNYDFFEVGRSGESDIDISGYRIQYYNSSDKLSGELTFDEPSILQHESIVFGFNKSPQYAENSDRFLYSFSSSGLASTAGRLRIVFGEEDDVVDEICWGKIACDNNVGKFATNADDNYSAVRCARECESAFTNEKYYPSIDEDVFYVAPEPELILCTGLKITEIYSYYENDSSEQFVEIWNSLANEDIDLSGCSISYEGKNYELSGILAANQFMTIRDIPLTKDPGSSLAIDIVDSSGVVDSVSYSHGQKKAMSNALINGL